MIERFQGSRRDTGEICPPRRQGTASVQDFASGSVVLLGLLGEYMGRIYGEVSAGHSIWSRSGGGSRPLAATVRDEPAKE